MGKSGKSGKAEWKILVKFEWDVYECRPVCPTWVELCHNLKATGKAERNISRRTATNRKSLAIANPHNLHTSSVGRSRGGDACELWWLASNLNHQRHTQIAPKDFITLSCKKTLVRILPNACNHNDHVMHNIYARIQDAKDVLTSPVWQRWSNSLKCTGGPLRERMRSLPVPHSPLPARRRLPEARYRVPSRGDMARGDRACGGSWLPADAPAFHELSIAVASEHVPDGNN